MGEPRVCFDANAYGRVLSELAGMGFRIGRYDIGHTGKYLCVDEHEEFVLLPVRFETSSSERTIWRDVKGNSFQILEKKSEFIPAVRAALGEEVQTSSEKEALIFRSIREFYQCFASGDEACEETARERVLTEKGEYEKKMILQEKVAQREREEQEKRDIALEVSKGHALRHRAIRMVTLAEEAQMHDQDINPDELKRIFNRYFRMAPDEAGLTKGEAEAYRTNFENMFAEMATTRSGALAIKYSGARVQCEVTKEYTGSKISCQSGEVAVPPVVSEVFCDGIQMSQPRVVLSEGMCKPVVTASR